MAQTPPTDAREARDERDARQARLNRELHGLDADEVVRRTLQAFDGESDIPPSDPRSPKWHPMRKSRWDAEVTGSEATMSCIEYGVPQIGNRITVTSKSGEVLSEETVDSGGYSTYDLMVRGPLACPSASASDRR